MSEEISVDKWFNKKISISLGKGITVIILATLCLITFNVIREKRTQNAAVNDTTGLEISTLVRNVKHELFVADSLRIVKKEAALFRLKDFQMEICFTVRQVTKEGVGANYKFVTIEGGSETGNEKVQKLILHWDAMEPQPIKVPPGDSESEMIVIPN
ncbi:MAG: trypco2 family protein [bacterium]